MHEEILYTVSEAADYLNLSVQTIRKYIKTGELKGIKLNRSYRIKLDAIIEFLNNKSI